MANLKSTLVFVHGWSVTNTNTYGGLPARLRNEAKARNFALDVKHIYLGRYISFHDEVTIADISRAFETAVRETLTPLLKKGARFNCITHSTGGPVVRDWWHRFYASEPSDEQCPMSHLIMLAPANFGSALAQLGKSRVSRLKNWFEGTEPGQGVLDWLELGSKDSWDLNSNWIRDGKSAISAKGIFPFVLTGQTIDRQFYDNLNSYTGESGSDGVVRVAAANLNSRIITLKQQAPFQKGGKSQPFTAPDLESSHPEVGPETAFRIVGGAAHSGVDKGIMRSIYRPVGHGRGKELVDAIFDCLSVSTLSEYRKTAAKQATETDQVQFDERLETEKRFLISDTHFIHDRYSMVVFRITDDYDHPVTDFDLLLTAGPNNDPNHLPKHFFVDRQQNHLSRNTVTYFINYDIMNGTPAVQAGDKVIREKATGVKSLGIIVRPRPTDGFVRYMPCEKKASIDMLQHALRPNETTLIDIRLRRVVHKTIFRLAKIVGDYPDRDFKKDRPGTDIVE